MKSFDINFSPLRMEGAITIENVDDPKGAGVGNHYS
jgi:hypothetical protein